MKYQYLDTMKCCVWNFAYHALEMWNENDPNLAEITTPYVS